MLLLKSYLIANIFFLDTLKRCDESWLSFYSLPLWLSGAGPVRESEGRAGNAKPTHSTAGEQLQGVGTLTWPVEQEITGQLRTDS